MTNKFIEIDYKDFDANNVKLSNKVSTLTGPLKKERINLVYEKNGEDFRFRVKFPRITSVAGVKHKLDIHNQKTYDTNGDPQLSITYNFDLSYTQKDDKKVYNNPEHELLVSKLNEMSELIKKDISQPEAYPDFATKLAVANKKKPSPIETYTTKALEEYRPIIFHVEDEKTGRVSDTTNANVGFYRPKDKNGVVPAWGPRGPELTNFTRLSQPNEKYFPNQLKLGEDKKPLKDDKGRTQYTPNYELLANKRITHEPVVEFYDVYYDDKNGPRVRAKQVSTIIIKVEAADAKDIQAEQREQLARDAHLVREAKQSDDILCQTISDMDIKSAAEEGDGINPADMIGENQ